MDFEASIWNEPSPAGQQSVAPVPIYKLGPGCDLADHDRAAVFFCPGCSRDPRVQAALQTRVEQNRVSTTVPITTTCRLRQLLCECHQKPNKAHGQPLSHCRHSLPDESFESF